MELIVHTEASLGRGGQEARIFTEMEYMRAQGYRCVLAGPKEGKLYARCQEAGFECWDVGFGKWSQLSDLFKLYRLFLQHKPLMVGTHSNIDSRVGLLAATWAGVPVRIRYRHLSIPVKNTPINRFIYKKLCDVVITTGDCISQPLIQTLGLAPERVHTIGTGLLPADPMPDREVSRRKIQQSLGLGPNARFVGMMAELRYWKGHLDIIKAFDSLAERFPDHHLVFVGGGTLEVYSAWKEGYAAKDRIHFVGFQKDFYDYFRSWDVALLASTQNEGIPQTLMHAMFAQTPVIGTRVGGIPEIVEDGVTGLLVPPASPGDLAAAIADVLAHPGAAQERAATAYLRAQRYYTLKVMGEKVTALIKRVQARKKS